MEINTSKHCIDEIVARLAFSAPNAAKLIRMLADERDALLIAGQPWHSHRGGTNPSLPNPGGDPNTQADVPNPLTEMNVASLASSFLPDEASADAWPDMDFDRTIATGFASDVGAWGWAFVKAGATIALILGAAWVGASL